MTDIATQLEEKRAGYTDESNWHKLLIDAYRGAGGFQGKVKQTPSGFWGAAAEAYSGFNTMRDTASIVDTCNTYLDKHPREDPPKFSRRVEVAHYLNYVKPITNLKISYIARRPHQRNNVPAKLADWIKRTKYDEGFRRRALLTAVCGWFPLVVDKPQLPEGATSAANAGNMDPYVRIAFPANLYHYDTAEDGSWTWAKLGDRYSTKPAWNQPEVKSTRYTVLTPAGGETWVKPESGDPVKTAEWKHPFKAVPIVTWRTDTSIEDPVKADSLNAEIVPEVKRLFNYMSEMDENLRSNVFALLLVPSQATDGAAGDADAPKTLGSENGLTIDPDQKNLPQFIAPPPTVAETYETRIEKTIIEVYRMARVEYDRASGARSNAQSQQQNFQQTNLAIVDFAKSLAAADRETLILVGRGLGIDEEKLQEIECVAHDSYAESELNDEIEQVIAAVTQLAVGNTAKGELIKRLLWRLLGGVGADTRKTIESEVDAAVKEAEDEAKLTAVAEREALKKPAAEDSPVNDPPDDDEGEP